jgi:hypothetical protein
VIVGGVPTCKRRVRSNRVLKVGGEETVRRAYLSQRPVGFHQLNRLGLGP